MERFMIEAFPRSNRSAGRRRSRIPGSPTSPS